MACGDLRLTESAAATTGSNFCPHLGPDMFSGSAAAAVSFAGQMMHHTLSDGVATCHCVSSCCLEASSPVHLASVGGRIFCKWIQW